MYEFLKSRIHKTQTTNSLHCGIERIRSTNDENEIPKLLYTCEKQTGNQRWKGTLIRTGTNSIMHSWRLGGGGVLEGHRTQAERVSFASTVPAHVDKEPYFLLCTKERRKRSGEYTNQWSEPFSGFTHFVETCWCILEVNYSGKKEHTRERNLGRPSRQSDAKIVHLSILTLGVDANKSFIGELNNKGGFQKF
jgi:hypothetical protein